MRRKAEGRREVDYVKLYEKAWEIALRLRSGQRFASLAMTRILPGSGARPKLPILMFRISLSIPDSGY